MHTVVIGGGVIGLTQAYHLAREGESVTVIDARATGLGASKVNAGWICPAESAPVPGPGVAEIVQDGSRFASLRRKDQNRVRHPKSFSPPPRSVCQR